MHLHLGRVDTIIGTIVAAVRLEARVATNVASEIRSLFEHPIAAIHQTAILW